MERRINKENKQIRLIYSIITNLIGNRRSVLQAWMNCDCKLIIS